MTVTASTAPTLPERAPRPRGLRSVPWGTATVLGAAVAFADGFWVTSLRGAVGAIQRVQSPFSSWLVQSLLMTPLFALAIAGALVVARRRFGATPRGTRAALVTAALVVVAGSLVGVGQVAATSVYDYRLQSRMLRAQAAVHNRVTPVVVGSEAPADTAATPATGPGLAGTDCDVTCHRQRETLRVHIKAIGYSTVVILLTNLVLVGWAVAWRGRGFDVVRGRRAPAAA